MSLLNENPSLYSKIHSWLNKTYGKAPYCSNLACQKTSFEYEWAKLKDKIYDFNIENFIPLCRKCHSQYDYANGKKRNKRGKVPVTSSSEVVIRLRKELGFTHTQFAYHLGVTPGTVCNWENGRREPRLPKIRKMVELAKKHKLKIVIADFLT